MDAIKKKMQGMKLEKDNAMDRALLCEQQARDANARAEKVNTKWISHHSPYDHSWKIDCDQLNYDDTFI